MRGLFGLFAALLITCPALAQTGVPAATLGTDDLPATADGATLLHVSAAGRFAITANSATGTALDLVDMITGPTPLAGAAGARDGRLDLLLDVGTYKPAARWPICACGATAGTWWRSPPSRVRSSRPTAIRCATSC